MEFRIEKRAMLIMKMKRKEITEEIKKSEKHQNTWGKRKLPGNLRSR